MAQPGLNGVRPRRPEQSETGHLEGVREDQGLNGVRPRRPEQFTAEAAKLEGRTVDGLNGVRPRRPEQWEDEEAAWEYCCHVSMESGLEDRNNKAQGGSARLDEIVSMESSLEDRNNPNMEWHVRSYEKSQWSPA